MTDRTPTLAAGPVSDERPLTETEVSDLRRIAHDELGTLAGSWDERMAEYDTRDAGSVGDEQRSLWKDARRRFFHNRTAMVGMIIVVAFVLLAIFAPMLSHHSPSKFDYARQNLSPRADAWFGTDAKGRDLWVRAWLGARLSLSIAAAVSLVILVVGIAYGSVSGYAGGRIDNAMMRLLDALYGLPYLPFAIITATVLRTKFEDATAIVFMVPALTLTSWFTAARIMRGQMLSLKQNEYIESARSNGAKAGRIIGRHVLPNAAGVMVVAIFLEIPNAILGEAVLSFLGLGVAPPETSWGQLAYEGYKSVNVHTHLLWVPALLIAVTVLATVAVADGVRDALDPRGQVH